MYQIMLVEDEALVRESMAQNTNWEKFGFAPPHVFENGRQAADHLETVLPDVVITEIGGTVGDNRRRADGLQRVFLRAEGHPLPRARLSAQAGQPEGI